MKFDMPKAGEWVKPIRSGYRLACCDCGLVHRIDFRVLKPIRRKDKAVVLGNAYTEFRVYRDDAATAELRATDGL